MLTAVVEKQAATQETKRPGQAQEKEGQEQ
jgi:hypothetical protein